MLGFLLTGSGARAEDGKAVVLAMGTRVRDRTKRVGSLLGAHVGSVGSVGSVTVVSEGKRPRLPSFLYSA